MEEMCSGRLIAAAAAATHTAAPEGAFAGEVGVFGHGFEQWIAVTGHHRAGEIAAFVWLHTAELFGATAEPGGRKDGKKEELDRFHGGSGAELTFLQRAGLRFA